MSAKLKTILHKVVMEDHKSKDEKIEEGIERYKSLLLEIAETKKWDLPVWVEGSEPENLKKYEKDLNLLERSNLIKGQMKYTERNAFREYKLTKKGTEIVEKLREES